MKKHETRLYNVLFPIWMLLLFPTAWLVVLPGNFLVDTAVLLAALWAMKLPVKANYKKAIFKVWIFGFVSDIIGGAFMLLPMFIDGWLPPDSPASRWWSSNVTDAIAANPFQSVWGFLWTTAALVVAALCIYLFNRHVSFKEADLSSPAIARLSLILALVTAPYLFYLPSRLIYGY